MNNFHCLLPEEKYTMTSQTSFDDREIEFVIKTANHLGWDTCYFCHFFELDPHGAWVDGDPHASQHSLGAMHEPCLQILSIQLNPSQENQHNNRNNVRYIAK
jgi:hypothetical protein